MAHILTIERLKDLLTCRPTRRGQPAGGNKAYVAIHELRLF
jgi:hypothetical protein